MAGETDQQIFDIYHISRQHRCNLSVM